MLPIAFCGALHLRPTALQKAPRTEPAVSLCSSRSAIIRARLFSAPPAAPPRQRHGGAARGEWLPGNARLTRGATIFPRVAEHRTCGGGGGGGGGGSGGGDGGDGGDGGSGSAPGWSGAALPAAIGITRRRMQVSASGRGDKPLAAVKQFFRALRISHLVLAINVAVFLLQGVTGSRLLLGGAKMNAEIAAGQLHRLVTPMFLHASVSHLLVNSFSLYSTGPSVESWFGRARFVSLYLMSGFCGNLLSFFCTPTPSVGASGAIFGLVGATAVLLARHRKILGPRSRKGLNSLAYIVLVNFGMGMSPASRIDNFGHLGGLLGGVLFAYLGGPRLVPVRSTNGRSVLVDIPLAKVALAEAKLFAKRAAKGLGPRKNGGW